MNRSSVPELYTGRAASYHRFVRLVGYPQGLRAVVAGGDFLRAGMKVLDAGCGSGLLTQACYAVAQERGLPAITFHGFDLTPHMLDRFRAWIAETGATGIALAQADALKPEQLPPDWTGYDLVVTASMLEYLPRDRVAEALGNFRARLKPGGRLLLFITRRNLLTSFLIRKWWDANTYTRPEIAARLKEAGFPPASFLRFPWPFRYLGLWGHAVTVSFSSATVAQ